jgi:hypothetical protein
MKCGMCTGYVMHVSSANPEMAVIVPRLHLTLKRKERPNDDA